MKRLAAIALLCGGQALLPVLGADGQARVPVLHYIQALQAIRAADATAARTQAQQLLGAEVESPAGRFTADAALLHEVMANPTGARAHLDAAIAALRAAVPAAVTNTDPRLLEKLRAEETAAAMKRGGEIRTAPADEKSLEEAASGLGKVWTWFEKQLDKLANWFERWWPREKLNEDEPLAHGTRPKWLVTIVVILIVIVLGILAFEVVRRSRAATSEEPVVTSDPIESRRDEDPLSRGANEWERYAAKLAAAGRTREAIRAWYHAVLVTLYAAGILHFKKGRTNWEYIAALAPDVAWRGEFVTMTRRFETEWYGRAESAAEALDDAAERARRILDAVRRRAAA
ncbi:MAG TPA: DUF4129 domain-containing protein [Thermoanaerobaculia bacterium]|nr:DUF4129 domain-containing protein [Thermoanaerobaculia bacterium]